MAQAGPETEKPQLQEAPLRTPADIARHCLRYDIEGDRVRMYARSEDGFSLLASFENTEATRETFKAALVKFRHAFTFVARRTMLDIAHALTVLAARDDAADFEAGFRATAEKLQQVLEVDDSLPGNDFLEHFVDPDAAARALIKALLKRTGGTVTMTSADLSAAANHHLFYSTKEKAFSLALGKVCKDPNCRHAGPIRRDEEDASSEEGH